MPVRTLNYTGRKRISREHARIVLHEGPAGKSFDATLKLDNYGLPPDACVYVEAYRQTTYMRFDFGTVGKIQAPSDLMLRDFGPGEGILFRVKVVAPDDHRLLAEADRITPQNNREGLLPVKPEDLGEEVWRLNFDDDQVFLLINSQVANWKALARDPVFIALVPPVILRMVLERIIWRENDWDTEDMRDWRSRWLRFAETELRVGPLPSGDDEESLAQWIEKAVYAFCERHRFCSKHWQPNWRGTENGTS
jgi:hypothetical protein